MALRLITSPAAEPVTLTEAKAQLRVTFSDDDALITNCIAAARARCELVTGRALITQTWQLELSEWPYAPMAKASLRNAVFIPKPPLASITSVKYIGEDDIEHALVSGVDYVSQIADPCSYVAPASGAIWPIVAEIPNAIRIRYVCGYGNSGASVPPDLRCGMLMLIDHMYRNRSDEITGTIVSRFDIASKALFGAYAVNQFA